MGSGSDHGGPPQKKICRVCTFEGISITVVGVCAFGILVLCFNMLAHEEYLDKKEAENITERTFIQEVHPRQERILDEAFEYEVMTSPLEWSPHVKWAIVSAEESTSDCVLCPVISSLASQGWRVIFFSEKSKSCCRSPNCEWLNKNKMPELPLRTARFTSGFDPLVKNIGFLLALSHEAQYILDVDVDAISKSMECQGNEHDCERILWKDFQKLTAEEDRSLFLKPSFGRRMYNPMKHFGCSDCWPQGFSPPISSDPSNSYFVCEKKPPAMQALLPFLPQLDHHAPSITVPPGVLAPSSVTASMFGPHVLWGSLLLAQGSPLLRVILVEALMGAEEGGTRFHLSELPATESSTTAYASSTALWNKNTQLLTEMARWACPLPTKLDCLSLLTKELFDEGLVTETDIELVEAWVFDISNMKNTTHHTKENTVYYRAPLSSVSKMCRKEAITGVRFYPAEPPIELSSTYIEEWNGKLEEIRSSLDEFQEKDEEDNAMVNTKAVDSFQRRKREAKLMMEYSEYHRDVIRDLADEMCPKFGELIPPVTHDKIDDILLIVTFHHPMYSVLPDLEVIYRNRFSNILYCGPNDMSIDEVIHKHEEYEGRSLSFYPVKESSEFECLIGAIEMGYDVDGYLFSSWNSLLNPWVIETLPTRKVWTYKTYVNDFLNENEDSSGLLKLLENLTSMTKGDKNGVQVTKSAVVAPQGEVQKTEDEVVRNKLVQNAHHHPFISELDLVEDMLVVSNTEDESGNTKQKNKEMEKRSTKGNRSIKKRSIKIEQSLSPTFPDTFSTAYHKLMAKVALAKDKPPTCASTECENSVEFLDNLYENVGKYYNFTEAVPRIPVYYVPKEFERNILTFAKLFRNYNAMNKLGLSFFFSGVTPKDSVLNLEGSKGDFEDFDSAAAVVHPVNLKEILTNPESNYLFCKQYLLTVMSNS